MRKLRAETRFASRFQIRSEQKRPKKALFPKVLVSDLKDIPVPRLSQAASIDRRRYDRMVQLVDQMLEAKKQLASARTERDKIFYENKCATLDRQIDTLVYELYDLTCEEIAVVEASRAAG